MLKRVPKLRRKSKNEIVFENEYKRSNYGRMALIWNFLMNSYEEKGIRENKFKGISGKKVEEEEENKNCDMELKICHDLHSLVLLAIQVLVSE